MNPADTQAGPRIGLIHALEESVGPARAAFRELWPEAECFDLLDTSLATDLARRGKLDQPIIDRFLTLGRYAAESPGAATPTQALLFTCSAFGPAIDAVKKALAIPVLRPNEAAFEEAVEAGRRIGLVVTFQPSLPSLTDELHEMAALRGKTLSVEGCVVDGALGALKAGRGEAHDELVAAAAARLSGIDVVVLGQFSLARARPAVARAVGAPVITTPHSAVRALKRALARSARSAPRP